MSKAAPDLIDHALWYLCIALTADVRTMALDFANVARHPLDLAVASLPRAVPALHHVHLLLRVVAVCSPFAPEPEVRLHLRFYGGRHVVSLL